MGGVSVATEWSQDTDRRLTAIVNVKAGCRFTPGRALPQLAMAYSRFFGYELLGPVVKLGCYSACGTEHRQLQCRIVARACSVTTG